MVWSINFSSKADKNLEKLDPQARELIHSYLKHQVLKLSHPKQLGKILHHDLKGLWRYRVNKFRIICQIQEDKLIILVIQIGQRDSIYNNNE